MTMQQIKPEEAEGKTVKSILQDAYDNTVIIFKDDTYLYLHVESDDVESWISFNGKPQLLDFVRKELIEAEFASAEDIAKAKQEQDEVQRNSRWRQYLKLKKEFDNDKTTD